jgi:hypothetical protein
MKIKEHSNKIKEDSRNRSIKKMLSPKIKKKEMREVIELKKKIIKKNESIKKVRNKIELSESIPTKCSSDGLNDLKNIEKRKKSEKSPENEDYKIYLKTEKEMPQKKVKHRSPLKTQQKFLIRKKLIRRLCPKNEKTFSQKDLSQKEKIIQNIFYKNDKYYYSDKINFDTILKLIYYENYKIEDIKEYISPSFKKLQDLKTFFEILINEAKDFSENIRYFLLKKISKLISQDENKNFKLFSKFPKAYYNTINELFFCYKHLESINFEIEKLTRIYLDNHIDNNKKFSFDTLQFHKKMFIDKVYNDSVIRKFIIYLYEFFRNNHFYLNKFNSSILKIEEIYDNLETNNKEDWEDNESAENEENLKTDESFKNHELQNGELLDEEEIKQKKREKRKLKRKKKKNQKNQKIQILQQQKEIEKMNQDLITLVEIFDYFDMVIQKSPPFRCITVSFQHGELI